MKINLDWSIINNDKDFQRLSNHLFQFEINRTYFIPSSPYIGRDGGWDGRFDGSHRGKTGLFSVQAKWTSKSFTEAITYLKQEIPKETKKAIGQKVDHLIITTNAELRPEQVIELTKKKPAKIKTLEVWHRETLTLKLYEQPFLCYFYFGKPQFPAFRTPESYFAEDKENLFLSESFGRSEAISELLDQITNDGFDVLIRHAPGGHGKSHFLHEVAKELDQSQDDYQVWIVNPNLRSLQVAFQDELVQDRKYILILDDADRYLNDLKHLIGIVNATTSIKLILGCRSAGLPLVEQELHAQRFSQFFVAELPQLEMPDLTKLLCLASGNDKIERAEEIINHLDRMPYLIVQYGKSIKGDLSKIDLDNIHTALTRLVADDAKKLLITTLNNPTDAESLLTNFASIVPFHETEKNLSILSEVIDQPPNVISLCIQKLVAGKILRYIGKSLRFYPDMSGDLFLSGQISHHQNVIEEILGTWFDHLPEKVIANISSAAPYDESESIQRVLSGMVQKWIEEAGVEPRDYHIGKLQWLERIIRFVPED